MSEESRELIWVPKSVADAHNKAESDAEKERLIRELIERKALDFTRENELLEEQELIFKGACLAHRNALRAVYEEENEKLEQLFCDIGDIGGAVKASAKAFAEQLQPVRREIDVLRTEISKLKQDLSSFSLYGLDELAKLINTLQYMSDGSKQLLHDVLSASKSEDFKHD